MRTALQFHAAHHPEIIARQDALLLGIYRLLRLSVGKADPDADLPPDYTDLTLGYLDDLDAILLYEAEKKKKTPHGNPGSRLQ